MAWSGMIVWARVFANVVNQQLEFAAAKSDIGKYNYA